MKWIKALAKNLEDKEVKEVQHCEVIEIDEMWHYIPKKKRKVWV